VSCRTVPGSASWLALGLSAFRVAILVTVLGARAGARV